MKIGGSPVADPNRLLEQIYRAKSVQPAPEPLPRLLEPGALLKGRVLSTDATGILTVATERGTFTTSSATALEVGQEFWFQVIQGGANPTVAEAGKANAVLSLLRVLLPEMLSGSGATTLAGLTASPTDTAPKLTQDELRLLGFLADTAIDGNPDPGKLLKTLSQLHLSLPSTDKKTSAEQAASAPSLLRSIDSPALQKLVRLLEAHATVNQQPAAATGSDFFLFPVFFAEQSGRGEWLFSYEKTSGVDDKTGETAISFYLTMSQLGDIHLKITSRPHALSGVFTLSSEDATNYLRQHLPQLTEALNPLASSVVISCRTAALDCLKTLKQEAMAKVGRESFALIDVKV